MVLTEEPLPTQPALCLLRLRSCSTSGSLSGSLTGSVCARRRHHSPGHGRWGSQRCPAQQHLSPRDERRVDLETALRAQMLQEVRRGRSAAPAVAPTPPGTQPYAANGANPVAGDLPQGELNWEQMHGRRTSTGRTQITLISTAAPGRCRLLSAVWVHRSPREVLPLQAVQEALPRSAQPFTSQHLKSASSIPAAPEHLALEQPTRKCLRAPEEIFTERHLQTPGSWALPGAPLFKGKVSLCTQVVSTV